MIPDFPDEKEKLMQIWFSYLNFKHNELLGFFGTIPTHRNHEGNQWDLNRADGTYDRQQYKTIETYMNIEYKDIPNLTSEKIQEIITKIAEDMARQMSQNMFAEISRVTKSIGNEVNLNGQPFEKESFLEVLSKIDIDFDENGKMKSPSIIMSPKMWEENKDRFATWEEDKDFLAKHEAIISKKREEWCDRENNRKLVD